MIDISYYSVIKIELISDFKSRMVDDIGYHSNETDHSLDMRKPEKIYRAKHDDDRYILIWKWNHSPDIEDFESWLHDSLRISARGYNIQIWEENTGYVTFKDIRSNKTETKFDPTIGVPMERGSLRPLWRLGKEFSTDINEIEFVGDDKDKVEVTDTGMELFTIYDDDEYREFADRRMIDLLIARQEAANEQLMNISASLNDICKKLNEIEDDLCGTQWGR